MKKAVKLSVLFVSGILFAIFLNSCSSSSTMVTGTWHKDNIQRTYDDILIAAMTSNVGFKSTVENALADELGDEGINTTTSIEVFPPSFIENTDQKQQILESIRTNGADAIMTISLIDKDTDVRYVPGSVGYAPYPAYGYYGSFWSYYDYWYPRFQTSGYYTEEKTYFIETNLYDAQTEELIWSAQSKTYSPDYLQTFSEDYAEEIADELMDQNIINVRED